MQSLTYSSEAEYEKDLIDALSLWGWQHVPGKNIELVSPDFPVWEEELRRQIKRINNLSDTPYHNAIVSEMVQRLKEIVQVTGASDTGLIHSAKEFLGLIRGGYISDSGNYKYIDFKRVENNSFVLASQLRVDRYRLDIVLFINGIPIVNIELKNPGGEEVSWEEAFDQISAYQRKFPELYTMVQIGVAAQGNIEPEDRGIRYFATMPWRSYGGYSLLDKEKIATIWDTKLILPDGTSKDVESPLLYRLGFLYPPVLLDILKYYIYVRPDKEDKIIARYMQYRAASKIFTRVKRYVSGEMPEDEKPGGVIWHWQGTGKSLTMAFAAIKLSTEKLEVSRDGKDIAKSVFFVVDRKSLAEQIYKVLMSIEPKGVDKPYMMETIEDLVKTIKTSGCQGKRGHIVTLIHKFQEDAFDELIKLCEQEERVGHETVRTSKKITVFIDEGHRSQAGRMGRFMRTLLAKAPMFAFTGTPKFSEKEEKDTTSIFGPILDRYFIADSLEDGYTLPIVLVDRLPDVHLKDEKIDEALKEVRRRLQEAMKQEGAYVSVGDIEEEVAKNLKLADFLGHEQRMNIIARDIAKHFLDEVNGKFKALVVAASRELAAKYRMLIDKYLREETKERGVEYSPSWVEAVFSENDATHSSGYIQEYILDAEKRYGKPYELLKKEFIDNFRGDYDRSAEPRILVVTNMLLTGYDVPVLRVMYFDRFMTDGGLLQALARTNRPYPGKDSGIVFDYVGILKNIERALLEYQEKGDVLKTFNDPKKVVDEIDALLVRLIAELKNIRVKDEEYLNVEDIYRLGSNERNWLSAELARRIASQKSLYGSDNEEVLIWRQVVMLAKKIRSKLATLKMVQVSLSRDEKNVIDRAYVITSFVLEVEEKMNRGVRKLARRYKKSVSAAVMPTLEFEEPDEVRDSKVARIDAQFVEQVVKQISGKATPAKGAVLEMEITVSGMTVDDILRELSISDYVPVDLKEKIKRVYKILRRGKEAYEEEIKSNVIELLDAYREVLEEREKYDLTDEEYRVYRALKLYFPEFSLKKNAEGVKRVVKRLIESFGSTKMMTEIIVDELELLDPEFKIVDQIDDLGNFIDEILDTIRNVLEEEDNE